MYSLAGVFVWAVVASMVSVVWLANATLRRDKDNPYLFVKVLGSAGPHFCSSIALLRYGTRLIRFQVDSDDILKVFVLLAVMISSVVLLTYEYIRADQST